MGFALLADLAIIQVIQSWQYLFMFSRENEQGSRKAMLQGRWRKAMQNMNTQTAVRSPIKNK